MQETNEIILFGPGLVGQALLNQIMEMIQRNHLPIKTVGIADSKALVFNPEGFSNQEINAIVDMKQNKQTLMLHPLATTLDKIREFLKPGQTLVDTTASESIHQLLLEGLAMGCKVVMANKRNLTQPWQTSQAFFNSPLTRYESTVCAGVPVMSSLARLNSTTDQIKTISGCLSGTLGYLCSQFDAGVSYSEAVRTAHKLGYTEPDPRDDLGGLDVARKALIMARSCGWTLEMEDIAIASLFTPELATLSPIDFLSECHQLDAYFSNKCETAHQEGKVLRYIATVTPQGGSTSLTPVLTNSDFGNLAGAGNKVVIQSQIYADNPLVISGSGAGAEITASGILADMIELIR